eukprot:g1280.t1
MAEGNPKSKDEKSPLSRIYFRGKRFFRMQEHKSALDEFEKIRAVNPLYPHINYEIAHVYLQMKENEKADAAFAQEIDLLEEKVIVSGRRTLIGTGLPGHFSHDKVYLWNSLGARIDHAINTRDKKKLVNATSYLKKVSGTSFEALYLRGLLHLHDYRYKEAQALLARCVADRSLAVSKFRRQSTTQSLVSNFTSASFGSSSSSENLPIDNIPHQLNTAHFETQFGVLKGSVMRYLGECQILRGDASAGLLNIETALDVYQCSSLTSTGDLQFKRKANNDISDELREDQSVIIPLAGMEPCLRSILQSFLSVSTLVTLHQLQSQCFLMTHQLEKAEAAISKAITTDKTEYSSFEKAYRIFFLQGSIKDMISSLDSMTKTQRQRGNKHEDEQELCKTVSRDMVMIDRDGEAFDPTLMTHKNWFRLISFYSYLLWTMGPNAELFLLRSCAFFAIGNPLQSMLDLRSLLQHDDQFLVNFIEEERFLHHFLFDHHTGLCLDTRLYAFVSNFTEETAAFWDENDKYGDHSKIFGYTSLIYKDLKNMKHNPTVASRIHFFQKTCAYYCKLRLQQQPTDLFAMIGLLRNCRASGNFQEAKSLVNKIQEENIVNKREKIIFRIEKALLLCQILEFKLSLQLLQSLLHDITSHTEETIDIDKIETTTGSHQLWEFNQLCGFVLGCTSYVYWLSGQVINAKRTLHEGLKLFPMSPYLHYHDAMLGVDYGTTDDILENVKALVEIDPLFSCGPYFDALSIHLLHPRYRYGEDCFIYAREADPMLGIELRLNAKHESKVVVDNMGRLVHSKKSTTKQSYTLDVLRARLPKGLIDRQQVLFDRALEYIFQGSEACLMLAIYKLIHAMSEQHSSSSSDSSSTYYPFCPFTNNILRDSLTSDKYVLGSSYNEEVASVLWERAIVYQEKISCAEAAFADYNRVVQMHPLRVDALYARAIALWNHEQYKRCKDDLTRCILCIQQVHFEGGKSNLANKALVALQLDCLYTFYTVRGITHKKLHDIKSAFADFDTAVTLKKSNLTALKERSELHIEMMDYRSAVRDLKEIFERDTAADPDAHHTQLMRYANILLVLVVQEQNYHGTAQHQHAINVYIADARKAYKVILEESANVGLHAVAHFFLGVSSFLQTSYTESLHHFSESIKHTDNRFRFQSMYCRGYIFWHQGKILKALHDFLLIAQNQPEYPGIYFAISVLYFKIKSYRSAYKSITYHGTRGLEGEKLKGLYAKALILKNLGIFDGARGAIEYYKKIIDQTALEESLQYLHFLSTYQLAYIKMLTNEFNDASELFMTCLNVDPTHRDSMLCLAYIQDMIGDLQKAEAFYNRLTFVDKTCACAFVWRGLVRFKMRKAQFAMVDYDRAISLVKKSSGRSMNPKDHLLLSKIYFLKAECYRYSHDTASALVAYETCLPNLEDYIQALEIQAEENTSQDKVELKDVTLEKVQIDIDIPQSARENNYKLRNIIDTGIVSHMHNVVGVILYDNEDWKRALSHFAAALKYDDQNFKAAYNHGIVEMGLKSFSSATSDFQTVLKKLPKFARAFNNLAFSYLQAGKITNGIDALKNALKIDKEDHKSEARGQHDRRSAISRMPFSMTSIIASYNLGTVLYQQEDFTAALEYLNIAQTKMEYLYATTSPSTSSPKIVRSFQKIFAKILCNRGAVNFRLHKFSEAEKDFERAVELVPSLLTEVSLNMAQLYFKVADCHNALRHLDATFSSAGNGRRRNVSAGDGESNISQAHLNGPFFNEGTMSFRTEQARRLWVFAQRWQWTLRVAYDDVLRGVSALPMLKIIKNYYSHSLSSSYFFNPQWLTISSSRESDIVKKMTDDLQNNLTLLSSLENAIAYSNDAKRIAEACAELSSLICFTNEERFKFHCHLVIWRSRLNLLRGRPMDTISELLRHVYHHDLKNISKTYEVPKRKMLGECLTFAGTVLTLHPNLDPFRITRLLPSSTSGGKITFERILKTAIDSESVVDGAAEDTYNIDDLAFICFNDVIKYIDKDNMVALWSRASYYAKIGNFRHAVCDLVALCRKLVNDEVLIKKSLDTIMSNSPLLTSSSAEPHANWIDNLNFKDAFQSLYSILCEYKMNVQERIDRNLNSLKSSQISLAIVIDRIEGLLAIDELETQEERRQLSHTETKCNTKLSKFISENTGNTSQSSIGGTSKKTDNNVASKESLWEEIKSSMAVLADDIRAQLEKRAAKRIRDKSLVAQGRKLLHLTNNRASNVPFGIVPHRPIS